MDNINSGERSNRVEIEMESKSCLNNENKDLSVEIENQMRIDAVSSVSSSP